MADSSHNDFIVDDYIDDYYVDSDTAAVVTDFDVDVGTVTAPRHRTAMGSPHALETIYWPPESPWAPYDAEPIFVLWTHLGTYAFGKVMPPDGIIDQMTFVDCTLIEVAPVRFSSTSIGQGMLGSVNAVDRPTSSVTIADLSGWWMDHFDREIFSGMPAGLISLVKRRYTEQRLTGTVGNIEVDMGRQVVTIEYGHYARQEP